MSARAITPDLLFKMWQRMVSSENWVIRPYTPGHHINRPNQARIWRAGGRLLRALWACYTIAFWCLLRFDEVLRIQVEDLEVQSPTVIVLTLRWRKTDQYGGMHWYFPSHFFPHALLGIKPFVLHYLPEEQAYLCPVRAIAEWIAASEIKTGYLFRKLTSDRVYTHDAPMVCNIQLFLDYNLPLIVWQTSQYFLEHFRNQLLDVNIDPLPYGTHSFRRGGCQWLYTGCRWDLRRICDWGGWSTEFDNLTIVKYILSWNDDPREDRQDFLNPNKKPTVMCNICGRSCPCS